MRSIVPMSETCLGESLYGARVPRLDVSEDELWLDAFGVAPQTEEVSGDELVRQLLIPIDVAEEIHVTWDVTDDSVRVRHRRADRLLVDLHREQATLLRVEKSAATTALIMEYRASDAEGRARIQVSPEVVIRDTFLRA